MKGINVKIQERTCNLIGEKNVDYFGTKTIAIIGLGGVGGAALSALARSGFMNFVLVDSSRVEYSNLNRQLLYTAGDVDLRKVDVAASFLGSLTDGISVECVYATVTDENIEELLGTHKIDYIIEAVDNLSAKATLIKYAHKHDIPIIVSAGISGRLDPTLIDITPLDKTRDDASARKIRQFCIKEGIDTREVMCVHSKEHPLQERSDVPNYMIMVPAAAGLFICYYIVQYYIEKLADEEGK